MGSGRRSFPRSPAAHLLLCGPVPNRPRTWTRLWPGCWGSPFQSMLPANSQTLSSGNHASALSSPAWCLLLLPGPGRLVNPLSHAWGCRPESRGCAGAAPRMRALGWAHSQWSSLTVELHGPQAALPGAPNAFQGFFTRSVRGLA